MSARPSRSRRLAREAAFQALYMVHVGRSRPPEAVATVMERQPFTAEAEEFLRETVEGVWERRTDIDETIEPHLSANWSMNRIAVSDLISLRIGVYELYCRPGVPPKVSITEAVELAKKYGTKDSGAFVNGVLGNVLPESPKAEWDPSMAEVFEEAAEAEVEQMPDEPDLVDPEDLEDGVRAGTWTLRSEE